MRLKEQLYQSCLDFVNKRHKTVESIMFSHQKALESETKSSAGDKHETGRAMLQLEMEKASQQLASIHQMKATLAKIDIHKTSEKACLGSLILTEKATYFLAISAGQIILDNQCYFVISVNSPIGKLLLGKQQNDNFVFNQKSINILKIN